MANVNSISSSSASSTNLYGTRNVLSGLASGMDTEAMIENSISGYKTKISGFQQKQTKLTWKQDAYRDIIDKGSSLLNKYTSYTSKTNLFSSSFFNKSTTSALGENASKVIASGRSSSDVAIQSVTNLATAARYNVGVNFGSAATPAGSADWNSSVTTSNIAGSSLTLKVNGEDVNVSFGKDDIYADMNAFVTGLNDKLSAAGSDARAEVVDGKIQFSGDAKIEKMTGALASAMKTNTENETVSYSFEDGYEFSKTETAAEYFSGKSFSVTFNGSSKTIKLGDIDNNGDISGQVVEQLNRELEKAFGSNKVKAELDTNGSLTFSALESNSLLKVTSEVGEKAGMAVSGSSNYLDTSRTLGDLIGLSGDAKQDLVINGVTIGSYGADTKFSQILSDINNSSAGVSVSYSTLTNQFAFSAKETGSAGRIDIGGDLGEELFSGGNKIDGKDAVLNIKVNGEEMTLTRASNTIDLDGMSVTLKGTFDSGDVTFETKADTDTIMDGIKAFVNDYNELAKTLHDAFATQPLTKSNKSAYEPLTDKDKEGMSETAIKNYEEKAKTGLLFGDSDLSTLYNRMNNSVSLNAFTRDLEAMGITTKYENGVTTLSIDEDKLRDAIDADATKVGEVFTASKANGAKGDGIMTSLKSNLTSYVSTSTGSMGILVKKAGAKQNATSLLNNTLQKQIDNFDKQISTWETKMSKQIDYYTRQFSALEQLINTMNNQSSALAGLMGG